MFIKLLLFSQHDIAEPLFLGLKKGNEKTLVAHLLKSWTIVLPHYTQDRNVPGNSVK